MEDIITVTCTYWLGWNGHTQLALSIPLSERGLNECPLSSVDGYTKGVCHWLFYIGDEDFTTTEERGAERLSGTRQWPRHAQHRLHSNQRMATRKLHWRFEIWHQGMQMYLMFARRLNAQGQAVNFTEAEKLQLALMVGGVVRGDEAVGFTVACEVTLLALRGNINETAAIHSLQGMKQNGDSITQYYQRVLKAARRINWEEYTAEKAVRDVITRGCDSDRLRLKALQDNPTLEDLFNTALSMENAQRKAKDMASTELVRRVENATPKDNNNGAASKAKKCVKCTYVHRRTQTTCPADGKPCNACKKPGHFKMSTLCQGQPTQPVRYLSSEEDVPAHPALSHKVRCVTGQPKPLVANRAISTLPAASDLPPGSTESDDSGREQSCVTPHTHTIRTLTTHPHQHTTGHCQVHINGVKLTLFADTGVKKTLLNRRHWECIQHTATMQRTTKTFSAYGAPHAHHLPVAARAKVTKQAEKGATTETYVYIVDDPSVESLLGRHDGIALS